MVCTGNMYRNDMFQKLFFQFRQVNFRQRVQTGQPAKFGDTCQILRGNNSLWLWVSSQIKSPFLNRRQSLKFFNLRLLHNLSAIRTKVIFKRSS